MQNIILSFLFLDVIPKISVNIGSYPTADTDSFWIYLCYLLVYVEEHGILMFTNADNSKEVQLIHLTPL